MLESGSALSHDLSIILAERNVSNVIFRDFALLCFLIYKTISKFVIVFEDSRLPNFMFICLDLSNKMEK